MRLRPAALFLFSLVPGALAWAATMPSKNAPVYLTANDMRYDRDQAVVIAEGKVEAVQGESILMADKMMYFQDKGVVEAVGHVTLLQPDGNVVFSDHMQLRDDLAQGIGHQMRVRMTDNSLFASSQGRKKSPTTYELRKAVYSPCKLCRDPKTGAVKPDPLWQIKADRINIDTEAQRVVYHNAFMEVYGVPVLYSPYFEHPTPNADRKSGLLTPQYSHNTQLGTTLQIPVYLNLAPDKDATLTPFLTTAEGAVLIGQYRQLTDKGYYQFDGSITDPDKRDDAGNVVPGESEIRGHLFAHGGSQLSDTWNWGFDVNRTTDDTYLRRYKFGNQNTLTSRLFAERIENRDYAEVEGLAFQGLQNSDDADQIPYVPAVKLHVESDPLYLGSRLSFDASGNAVQRKVGDDSRRATAEAAYTLPLALPGGQKLQARADLRTDAYSTTDVVLPNGDVESGGVSRTIPLASLDWRYPLIRYFGKSSWTVEPQVELIASSNGNNPDRIPNEDSRVPEFTDVNLFSTDRYPGYDRIENGTRLVYGINNEYHASSGVTFNALLGQDIQLLGDRAFPVSDDVSQDVSDYVGRIGATAPHYELNYRFRLDSDNYHFNEHDVHTGINISSASLYADYISTKDTLYIPDREEGILSGDLKLGKEWTLNAYARRDFNEEQMISAGGGLTFANECITVVTRLDREYVRDRDVEPDTSVSVRLFLKNIN